MSLTFDILIMSRCALCPINNVHMRNPGVREIHPSSFELREVKCVVCSVTKWWMRSLKNVFVDLIHTFSYLDSSADASVCVCGTWPRYQVAFCNAQRARSLSLSLPLSLSLCMGAVRKILVLRSIINKQF